MHYRPLVSIRSSACHGICYGPPRADCQIPSLPAGSRLQLHPPGVPKHLPGAVRGLDLAKCPHTDVDTGWPDRGRQLSSVSVCLTGPLGRWPEHGSPPNEREIQAVVSAPVCYHSGSCHALHWLRAQPWTCDEWVQNFASLMPHLTPLHGLSV